MHLVACGGATIFGDSPACRRQVAPVKKTKANGEIQSNTVRETMNQRKRRNTRKRKRKKTRRRRMCRRMSGRK